MTLNDELAALDKLYRSGLLTDREYAKKRKRILKSAHLTAQGSYAAGYTPMRGAMPTPYVLPSTVKMKSKWVALLLCFFFGLFGAHKYYEGKFFVGTLYLFTAGLFGIGAVVDFFVLLFKPNPYFV